MEIKNHGKDIKVLENKIERVKIKLAKTSNFKILSFFVSVHRFLLIKKKLDCSSLKFLKNWIAFAVESKQKFSIPEYPGNFLWGSIHLLISYLLEFILFANFNTTLLKLKIHPLTSPHINSILNVRKNFVYVLTTSRLKAIKRLAKLHLKFDVKNDFKMSTKLWETPLKIPFV